jgi:hypothetical protein
MNENNFTLQHALDGNYLNISLEEPVSVDNIAVNALAEDCPDFLIPFKLVNINNRLVLKYRLTNSVALAYANLTFDKNGFLDFLQKVLSPFMSVSDWFLNYHYICLNENYVFLSKNSMSIQYVYIPEMSYGNSDEAIVGFLQSVINKVEIADDSDFLLRLYRYFNFNRKEVSLLELNEMIYKEKMKNQEARKQSYMQIGGQAQVVKPPIQEPEEVLKNQPQTPPENKQADKEKDEPIIKHEDYVDKIMGELLDDDKKKKGKEKKEKKVKPIHGVGKKNGLFGKKNPIQQPSNELIQNFNNGNNYNNGSGKDNVTQNGGGGYLEYNAVDSENTVIIEDTKYENTICKNSACLELIESSTPRAIEEISLNFPGNFITIGRNTKDVNKASILFENTFSQISRLHARIERDGNSYYLIDLGSGNKTKLNHEELIPNKSYELHKDDKVILAANSKPVIYKVVM